MKSVTSQRTNFLNYFIMTIKGVNGFTPKTVLEYSVQSFYFRKYEDVYSTSDYKEAKQTLKNYRDNQKDVSHRLITRRVPNV